MAGTHTIGDARPWSISERGAPTGMTVWVECPHCSSTQSVDASELDESLCCDACLCHFVASALTSAPASATPTRRRSWRRGRAPLRLSSWT